MEIDNLFVYKWVLIFQALITMEITFLHVFSFYLQGTARGLPFSFDSCLTNIENQVLHKAQGTCIFLHRTHVD